MCGFVGFVSASGKHQLSEQEIASLAQTLQHRGPDQYSSVIAPGISIGFQRLAIIGLQGGDQPIFSKTGSFVVCNGEIYNHRSLRRFITTHGCQNLSPSDAGVLLPLYEKFGMDFLKSLDGMFALALWDNERRELILARDRIGIKPLYYAPVKEGLLFSSEPRAILASPLYNKQFNFKAFDQYLTYDYVPAPLTIFQGIFRLEPGQFLSYRDGTHSIFSYWDLSFEQSESRPPLHIGEQSELFRSTLQNVVQDELASEVPVGIFLSGGIDSSAIAAAAVRVGQPIQTFSARFDHTSFDESTFAHHVAQTLGTSHHEIRIEKKDCLDIASRLGSLLDEPLGDSSFIPTYLLSRFARSHVKVVLGGDGGDELFGGYPTYQAHNLIYWYEKIIPHRIRSRILPWLVSQLPVSFGNMSFDFRLRRFLSGKGVPLGVRHHLWMSSVAPDLKRELLHASFPSDIFDTFEIPARHLRNTDAREWLNRILYCDIKMYLEGNILAKVDRASMLHSLEVRVPLLNRRIVQFAQALPNLWKLHGFETKYFLKKTLEPWLPSTILHRKKKGFNFPVAEYLNSGLEELLGDTLSEEKLKVQGFFNHKKIQQLLSEHRTQRADHRKALWNILVFQLWYDYQFTA